MASIKLINGKEFNIKMYITPATIEKVEKWNETSFTMTNQVSGGGGYIYQGSGYIEPISFTTTTSSVNTRHTRIYYKSDEKSDAISAYGFDLQLIEGTRIDLAWYVCEGFNDKIAGFLDYRSNSWFMLNSPQDYLMSWLGISWINFPYIKKNSIIIGVVILICFIINMYFGIVAAFLGGIFWYIALGKPLLQYLKSKSTYTHFTDMTQADNEIRKEFLRSLSVELRVKN
jgi:hypothetical protein